MLQRHAFPIHNGNGLRFAPEQMRSCVLPRGARVLLCLAAFGALFTLLFANAATAADFPPAGSSEWPLVGRRLLLGVFVWASWALPALGGAYLTIRFAEPAALAWLRARRETLRFDIAVKDSHGHWQEAKYFATVRATLRGAPVDVLIVSYGIPLIQLFDTRTGELIRQIEVPGSVSIGLLVVTSQFIVFTANGGQEIRRIPLKEILESERQRYEGVSFRHPADVGMVTALACHPDGKLLGVGDSQGAVCIYPIGDGCPVGRISRDPDVGEHSPGEITSIAFHPARPWVAVSGGGGVNQLGRVGSYRLPHDSAASPDMPPPRSAGPQGGRNELVAMNKFFSDPWNRIAHLAFSPIGDRLGYVVVKANNVAGSPSKIVLKDAAGGSITSLSDEISINAPNATLLSFNQFNDRESHWNRIVVNGPHASVYSFVNGRIVNCGPLSEGGAEDGVQSEALFTAFLKDGHRVLKVGRLTAKSPRSRVQYVSVWLETRSPQPASGAETEETTDERAFPALSPLAARKLPAAAVRTEMPASNLRHVSALSLRQGSNAPMPWRHKTIYSTFVLLSVIPTLLSLRPAASVSAPAAVKPAFPELRADVNQIRAIVRDAQTDDALPDQKESAKTEWRAAAILFNKRKPESYPGWFQAADAEETRAQHVEGASKVRGRPTTPRTQLTLNDVGTLQYFGAIASYHVKDRPGQQKAIDKLKSYPHAKIATLDGSIVSVPEAVAAIPIITPDLPKAKAPNVSKKDVKRKRAAHKAVTRARGAKHGSH